MSSLNRIIILVQFLTICTLSAVFAWQYLDDRVPKYDEYYHFSAAKSNVADGSFSIQTGEYQRAAIFTVLVSKSIKLFGENWVSARLPAYIAGVLLVGFVFLWMRINFDTFSAWISSCLLLTSPMLVANMQFCRFYTLHALLFFLIFTGAYYLAGRKWKTREILILCGTLIVFFIALYFQVTTLVGVAFISSWLIWNALYELIQNKRYKTVTIILCVSFILILVALLLYPSTFLESYNAFNAYPLWAAGNISNKLFYVYLLKSDYPILFSIFPFSILVSLYLYPRVTMYMVLVLIGTLLVHSFASMKSSRYILYVFPFFCILSAVFISYTYKKMKKLVTNIIVDKFEFIGTMPNVLLINTIANLALLIAIIFVIGNTSAIKTITSFVGSDAQIEPFVRQINLSDWRKAEEFLKDYNDTKHIIISSAGIKAYHHLGRLDYDLNASIQSEVGGEYSLDHRTGARIITTASSVKRIIADNDQGIIIIEAAHMNNPGAVPEAVSKYIELNLEGADVPEESGLKVFVW